MIPSLQGRFLMHKEPVVFVLAFGVSISCERRSASLQSVQIDFEPPAFQPLDWRR